MRIALKLFAISVMVLLVWVAFPEAFSAIHYQYQLIIVSIAGGIILTVRRGWIVLVTSLVYVFGFWYLLISAILKRGEKSGD